MSLLPIASLALLFGEQNRATFHADGRRPESDTTHTVMLGLLAIDIAFGNPRLDLNIHRLSTLALVHDLAEAYAGDTNTAGGLTPEQRAAKEDRERAAIARIRSELGALSPIVIAIEQYESEWCPEARFLRYLDKITPKLTHTLNGCAAIRRMGWTVEQLRERHRTQGAELAAKYPEFAGVLGPLFDAAAAESEAALAAAPKLTNCNGCAHDYRGPDGSPRCKLIDETDPEDVDAWIDENLDDLGFPKPDATDCPGFAEIEVEQPAAPVVGTVTGGVAIVVDERPAPEAPAAERVRYEPTHRRCGRVIGKPEDTAKAVADKADNEEYGMMCPRCFEYLDDGVDAVERRFPAKAVA